MVKVNLEPYKEVENKQSQIVRRMRVENEDDERKGHNWRHIVKIDPKFILKREKFIGMMTGLESISDVHLGCKSVTKHRIELPSDEIRHVHRASYRARRGAREFEKRRSIGC